MIVISEVINWLRDDSVVSRRGPNAIVVAADFYDYELVATVYQLPEEKNNVILQLKSILDSMVDAGAEDCNLKVHWGKKSLNENKKNFDELFKRVEEGETIGIIKEDGQAAVMMPASDEIVRIYTDHNEAQ